MTDVAFFANQKHRPLSGLTLREQMKITDGEVAFRKQILGLSADQERLLLLCKDYIDVHVGDIVQQFYDEQTKIKEIELLIGDADTLSHLQSSMTGYVRSLFGGEYGSEYVSSRLRIGLVHKRIGVPPKLYLCGIKTLSLLLNKAVQDFCLLCEDPDQATAIQDALSRLLFFDIGLVFDTYIRSLTAEIEVGRDRLERHAADLEHAIADRTRELERLAQVDHLTGLYNRRAFNTFLRRELALAKRCKRPLTLIYFDLDGFKSLNDQEGHKAGDQLLSKVGGVIRNVSRETDYGCRYGGDEFCVILPDTSKADAGLLCERINQELVMADPAQRTTISVGVVQAGPDQFMPVDELVRLADHMMYEAKKTDGFCVAIHDNDKPPSPAPAQAACSA